MKTNEEQISKEQISDKSSELLTITEVCERLHIAEKNTVYSYIQNGELAAFKIGGNGAKGSRNHWRVRVKDLDTFIMRIGVGSKQTESQ